MLGIDPPGAMIYGHTHEVIPATAPVPFQGLEELEGKDLLTFNAGGWLRDGTENAGIFFLGDTGEMVSEKITLR
jgi:hypothetical protein